MKGKKLIKNTLASLAFTGLITIANAQTEKVKETKPKYTEKVTLEPGISINKHGEKNISFGMGFPLIKIDKLNDLTLKTGYLPSGKITVDNNPVTEEKGYRVNQKGYVGLQAYCFEAGIALGNKNPLPENYKQKSQASSTGKTMFPLYLALNYPLSKDQKNGLKVSFSGAGINFSLVSKIGNFYKKKSK